MKIFCLTLIFFAASIAHAQQPFVTDDVEVADKGKFTLETANEFDRLQPSSAPDEYQNSAHATLSYGLVKDVEISITGQFLALISRESPRVVGGIGDTTLAVKYNFLKEKDGSRRPALAVSGFVQLPTGDEDRGLGSGVPDYGFNAIAEKTYHEKNIFRLNGGYLFSGNTVNGDLGFSSEVHGGIFTGGASYVRKIGEKLQLGAELTTAVTSNFELEKGELQTQFGGNYELNKKTTFDFGIIFGKFDASPRAGFQVGFTRDF
jgi:hypothetical protein